MNNIKHCFFEHFIMLLFHSDRMNKGSVSALTMNPDFTENRNISIPSYWWLTSSGTPAADGCWPGKAASTKSSTGWCWSNLLRGSLRRRRSGSSATARRRWTWPSNSLWTRWWRATGLAKPYRPSLSLSPPLLCLPLSSYPGPVPAWFPEPSPDGEEDRHRSRRP